MQSITKVLWGNGQSEVVTKRIAPGLHAYGRCGTSSTKPMLYDSEPLCCAIHVHTVCDNTKRYDNVILSHTVGALTDVEKYSTQLY